MASLVGKVLYVDGRALYTDGRRNSSGHIRWRCRFHKYKTCRYAIYAEEGTGTVAVQSRREHTCPLDPLVQAKADLKEDLRNLALSNNEPAAALLEKIYRDLPDALAASINRDSLAAFIRRIRREASARAITPTLPHTPQAPLLSDSTPPDCPPSLKRSAESATQEERRDRPTMNKPKLYSSWFCPFAQRAWIGLVERGVDFELIDIDPYDKTPEFLAVNPRGLVPTLLHNGKSVYESTVLLEYVDEAWPNKEAPYLPGDAHDRAVQRIWVDHINKRITPPFYRFLMKNDPEAKEALLKAVGMLVEAMDVQGPFFRPGPTPTIVDLMLAPFALRFATILDHYRGFEIPSEATWSTRFNTWLNAISALPSVQATLAPTQKLQAKYQRYADDSAASEVADAIRKGTVLP